MKKYFLLFWVGVMLLIMPVSGYCDETQFIEPMGNGSVNWTDGTVEAVGIGVPPEKFYGKPQARPMAIRAAKLDAMRNLLEVTQGVRIDASTTVKNFAVENDVIMSRVDGMVKGAEIVKQEYMSDGTVEVTMRMSIRGSFAQLVLPQDVMQLQPIQPMDPGYSTPPSFPVDTPPPTAAMPAQGVYTGLVIDARGLGAKPAMSPKILDEDGQEVYGSAYVSREYAVQQGMSGYAKEITAAQNNQRVTNNPLTAKGIKTEGPGRSDVVISNADAAKIRSASENLSFMKQCRVMIVLD